MKKLWSYLLYLVVPFILLFLGIAFIYDRVVESIKLEHHKGDI